MGSETWPHYWSACSTRDFARWRADGHLQRVVAVLPLGATEQHGPHLPVCVDAALADGLVQASLEHLDPAVHALFLPTQCVGYSPEHSAFGGTLTLGAATLIALWTEIAQCVAASGVRKLVLFNTHGGQAGLLDVVARDLRTRLGLLVVCCNWWNLPLLDEQGQDANALFDAHEHRFGIHAGAIETSMMLALSAAQVDMAQAADFASSSEQRARDYPILGNGRSAKFAWAMQDYNPQGAVGNAAAASADKGRVLVRAAGRALAQLLSEVDRLPLETLASPPP
ncbi:MAG: creatininase family protein [Rhodoferax sp.]